MDARRKLRVLVYGVNFHPETVGIGKYTGELAAWLLQSGHEVRAVAAPPYYPRWALFDGYRQGYNLHERYEAIEIKHCPIWLPSHPSAPARIVHMASFVLSSAPVVLWQALRFRPDVVLNIHPFALTGPVAWAAARLARAALWVHVQDFELSAAAGLRMIGPRSFQNQLRRLQRMFLRKVDRVSSISQTMCAELQRKGAAPARVAHVPNWVDAQEIRPQPEPAGLRAELGLPQAATVVLWSGTMNRKQGLESVVQAARILEGRADIVFCLAGEGVERPHVERLGSGLPNVRLAPLQPRARLNDLLNTADVHLLPQRAEVADFCLPSKLAGMLASGRPVVATAAPGTELARIVGSCGIVVAPADGRAIADAVLELADDAARRQRLGRAARAFAVEHYDKEKILARLEVDLQTLHRERQVRSRAASAAPPWEALRDGEAAPAAVRAESDVR